MSLVRLYLVSPLKNSHWKRKWNDFDWFRPKSHTYPLPQVPPPSPIPLGVRFSTFRFGRGHTPSDHSILQAMCEAFRHPNKMGFLLPKGEGKRSREGVKAICSISEYLSLLCKHHFSIFYGSLWSLGRNIPALICSEYPWISVWLLCGFYLMFC